MILQGSRLSRRRPSRSGRLKIAFVVAVLIVLAALGLAAAKIMMSPDKKSADVPGKATDSKNAVEEKPKPPLVNLQPAVDAWVAKQAGEYGIMVYDPDNNVVIASHDTGTQFFTASIYKLYAVYLSFQDIEAGKHSLSEAFKFGKTRQQCLHDAIHTSDSPCAEALLNEIGQDAVTQRLKTIGLTGTSFPAFVTSAQDVMLILQRLYSHYDLNDNSTELMLEAMRTQVYRDGLPKGMPEAVVADKVGFSEAPHYHDVGIVTLPGGRNYIVVFLSKGVGSRVVADFGSTIYQVLK